MDLYQHLDWDSGFFGRRIARINSSRLKADEFRQVIQACQAEEVDCIYLLADSDDDATIAGAENFGFHLVDLRVTLKRPAQLLPPVRDGIVIRPARKTDVSVLKSIASVSHRDSRFYHDGHFPAKSCDLLYETWIEKSCDGYADIVLVPELESQAAGYISCHVLKSGEGQIGLVGVAPERQGRRLGEELVKSALSWFQKRGTDTISVVTQGRNLRAQRLYQRCGFVTQSVQIWYHKWLSQQDSEVG
jgi:dTDP-4-amino-4,6-dideoxy-D-galactose acyltransferase